MESSGNSRWWNCKLNTIRKSILNETYKKRNHRTHPNTHSETARSIVPIIIHSFLVTGPIFFSFSAAKAGASGVSLTSGGYSLHRISGVRKSATSAGRLAILNQVTHGEAIFTPSSSANLRHSRFWAAAVRKRALELPADCHAHKKWKGYNGIHVNTYLIHVTVHFYLQTSKTTIISHIFQLGTVINSCTFLKYGEIRRPKNKHR